MQSGPIKIVFFMNHHPNNFSQSPHRRPISWLVVSVACLVAAGPAMAAATVATNQLSAVSILKDIRNEIHNYSRIQSANLLVVVSLEDDRPVYVDHALLLLQLPKGKWMLVHANRAAKPSPVLPTWNPKWQPATVTDSPRRFDRPFDHPPTREEVNRFLKDNEFQLESDKLFRVVERLVYDEAWEKALGYKSGIKPLKRSSTDPPTNKNANDPKPRGVKGE